MGASSADSAAWGADLWATLCQTDTNTSSGTALTSVTSHGHPDSIFSFSSTEDGGTSSADGFLSGDWGSSSGGEGSEMYRGILMPAEFGHDDGEVDIEGAWKGALSL